MINGLNKEVTYVVTLRADNGSVKWSKIIANEYLKLPPKIWG